MIFKSINENSAKFTNTWFREHIANWTIWLDHLKNKPGLRFLEIGSYEGQSTRWILENILTHPTSRLYCVDPFICDLEGKTDLINRFEHNIQLFKNKIKVFRGFSQELLRSERTFFTKNFFDFIYVDGAHASHEALEDAVLCFRILKQGGILIFDDYELNWYEDPKRNPKLGIDAWLSCFAGQYQLIYKGFQVCITKL